jgi:DNA-binding beta-propeller fold protein YncE
MKMIAKLLLLVCAVVSSHVAAFGQTTPVPPPATATPSHPFFITKTWVIGGVGDWDYLTVDPTARELFIAHGPTVQVVDIDSGTVAGTVKGFRQAHAIVLDAQGGYGYVSDGQADVVRVFDRHSFQVVANIPTGPAPRSMALDPSSGLLFVVGGQPAGSHSETQPGVRPNPAPRTAALPGTRSRATPHGSQSSVTVIDVEHRNQLAQLVIPGKLGFIQSDGGGRVYVTVQDRNQIIRLNAQAIGNALHRFVDTSTKLAQRTTTTLPGTASGGNNKADKAPVLDWYPGAATRPPAEALPFGFNLDSACQDPRALAVDASHARLFAACSNFRMVVVNPQTGNIIAALPIGPGPDAIGYDANRGLIYTANGGGDGSLTIIRQDVTDTYSVIQTLPTRQHARTLAIDPASGDVYLTSVIYGAEMNTPMTNGRPAPLNVSPVDSSFQVLVVGN